MATGRRSAPLRDALLKAAAQGTMSAQASARSRPPETCARPNLCQEVRFLFPVLPLFNALAAAALARAYNNRRKSWRALLLFLACVGVLGLTLLAKLIMSWAAYWNYPVQFWFH